MKIGIIGTGNMGRALGLGWARAGHEVFFGSRDAAKAEAVAAQGSGSTRAGGFDDAAAFGDVILYTIRDHFPSSALKEPRALSGKIVIDCNNSAILGLDVPDPEKRPGIHFTPPVHAKGARIEGREHTLSAVIHGKHKGRKVPRHGNGSDASQGPHR